MGLWSTIRKATQKSYEILKTNYSEVYSKMQQQNLFNLEEQIQGQFLDKPLGAFF